MLFVAVSRGFASRRWLSNALVGLVLASCIFGVFNYALGLTLPAGLLQAILP
jgi:putative tricarboxylic transport membrane protein